MVKYLQYLICTILFDLKNIEPDKKDVSVNFYYID